jgi:undecaprenyl-diphosphatase
VPVTLAVLLTALVAAAVVWVLSRSPRTPDPADPEPQERWLVGWLRRHPRFGAAARAIDRQAAGGLIVAVALGIVFATALVVGLLFDMVDRDTGLARWDTAVAEWGSEHATSWSTSTLDRLTDLGGTGYLVIIAAVVAAYDYIRYRNRNVVLFLIVVLGGVSLINNALKLVVDRERPDVPHLVGAAGSSFPSGHSAAAAAAWFAMALVLGRSLSARGRAAATALAAVITFAVAASRALLGVHWLTDVVAGVAVGWGWFLLVALAFGGRIQRLGEPVERVAAGAPRPSVRASPRSPRSTSDARPRPAPLARGPSALHARGTRAGRCDWRRTDHPRGPR